MTDATTDAQGRRSLSGRLLYVLSVALVLIGLVNATPGIPGYDGFISTLFDQPGLQLRKFPFEWFYPAFFALMMLVVVLKHSMWRDWQDRSAARRALGLFLDIALVAMAFTVSFTYLVEIESINEASKHGEAGASGLRFGEECDPHQTDDLEPGVGGVHDEILGGVGATAALIFLT